MRKTRCLLPLLLIGLLVVTAAASAAPLNFQAHLSGDDEVPAVDTDATGHVVFQLNSDGTALDFRLIVANLDNPVAAHIHCAPVGVNGPVGVLLFSTPTTGTVNGILAEGTITAPNTGNACGWTDLAAVVAALESGNAYVNVHTSPAHPGGEIRGQVR
ncbi:MAG: CHRD domain-containing protein [Chloroflexi bacterium]|nr:CHRD domain-containing protein [Chloroflexota bacterium]MCI0576382.1 CHRD domain-containing protein [Chloroflexota bacterium]MCI0643865.1 CHRD domain-containing protein [Chloroflexota bacterium]MCI0730590.1 CHRD domain-containing protein [Chloroflexota bacterium]